MMGLVGFILAFGFYTLALQKLLPAAAPTEGRADAGRVREGGTWEVTGQGHDRGRDRVRPHRRFGRAFRRTAYDY